MVASRGICLRTQRDQNASSTQGKQQPENSAHQRDTKLSIRYWRSTRQRMAPSARERRSLFAAQPSAPETCARHWRSRSAIQIQPLPRAPATPDECCQQLFPAGTQLARCDLFPDIADPGGPQSPPSRPAPAPAPLLVSAVQICAANFRRGCYRSPKASGAQIVAFVAQKGAN